MEALGDRDLHGVDEPANALHEDGGRGEQLLLRGRQGFVERRSGRFVSRSIGRLFSRSIHRFVSRSIDQLVHGPIGGLIDGSDRRFLLGVFGRGLDLHGFAVGFFAEAFFLLHRVSRIGDALAMEAQLRVLADRLPVAPAVPQHAQQHVAVLLHSPPRHGQHGAPQLRERDRLPQLDLEVHHAARELQEERKVLQVAAAHAHHLQNPGIIANQRRIAVRQQPGVLFALLQQHFADRERLREPRDRLLPLLRALHG